MPFPLTRLQVPDRPPPPLGTGDRFIQQAAQHMGEGAQEDIRQREVERHNLALEGYNQGQLGVQRDQLAGLEESRRAQLDLKTQEYQLKRQQDEEKQAWEKAKRIKVARQDLAAATEVRNLSGIAAAQAELDSLGVVATREGEETPQAPGGVPVQTDLSVPTAPPSLGGIGPYPKEFKPRPINPMIQATVPEGPVPDVGEPTGRESQELPSEGASGTPPMSPPMVGQGPLQAPPSLGMGLPPMTPPQAPPAKPGAGDWWVLRDKQTGQEITRWSQAQVRQEGYDALKDQFTELLDAADPSVRQAAEVAYTLHRARIGFAPTTKVLADAAKDAERIRSQQAMYGLKPKGGPGTTGDVIPKVDFDRQMKIQDAVRSIVRDERLKERFGDTVTFENASRSGMAALGAENRPGDILALKAVVRSLNGANSSDREFNQIFSMAGRWAQLAAQLEAWKPSAEDEPLPEGLREGLAEHFQRGSSLAKQRRAETGEMAAAMAWNLPGSEQERAQYADQARGQFTGTFGQPSNRVPATVRGGGKPALRGNVKKTGKGSKTADDMRREFE